MKEIDLAYLAGIIDGEGCITILEQKAYREKGRKWRLHVTIVSTEEWLLKWVQFLTAIGKVYILPKKTGKNAWQWRVADRKAGEFLRLILPYLKIKKPQAEIALQYQDRMDTNYHKERTTEHSILDEADCILIRSYK